jgi:hypothetical protein
MKKRHHKLKILGLLVKDNIFNNKVFVHDVIILNVQPQPKYTRDNVKDSLYEESAMCILGHPST